MIAFVRDCIQALNLGCGSKLIQIRFPDECEWILMKSGQGQDKLLVKQK